MDLNMENGTEPAKTQTGATQSSSTILNSSFLADTFLAKRPRSQYDDIEVPACLPDSVFSNENDDISAQVEAEADQYLTADNNQHLHNDHNSDIDDLQSGGSSKLRSDETAVTPVATSEDNVSLTTPQKHHLQSTNSPKKCVEKTASSMPIIVSGVDRYQSGGNDDLVESPSRSCHPKTVNQSEIIDDISNTVPITISCSTPAASKNSNHGDSLSTQPASIYSSAQRKENVVETSSAQQYIILEGTSLPIVADQTGLTQCDLNALFNVESTTASKTDDNAVPGDHVMNLLSNLPATSFIVDSNGSIYAIQSPAENVTETNTSCSEAPVSLVTADLDKAVPFPTNVSEGSIVHVSETTKVLDVASSITSHQPVAPVQSASLASTISLPPTSLSSLSSQTQAAAVAPAAQTLPVILEQPAPEPERPASPKKKMKRKRGGGWPKGKKRKNTEDFKIKGPKTAYLLFAQKRRKELIIEKPGYTFAEITVIMGREWTVLDPDIKDQYTKQAGEDMKRFTTELKEYQQTEEYRNILAKKRSERETAEGMPPDEDLGYIEEEYTLYCHICDQRFSNSHNRKEHLAGRQHLNKLRAEMTKQACPPKPPEPEEPEVEEEEDSSGCCIHCVNRVTDVSLDVSLDINTHIETFIFKHSQRELELHTLRANLKHLKEINSQLSKELISLQEAEVKLRQDLQTMKQWSLQLTHRIDNLKMVPTLFGVINF